MHTNQKQQCSSQLFKTIVILLMQPKPSNAEVYIRPLFISLNLIKGYNSKYRGEFSSLKGIAHNVKNQHIALKRTPALKYIKIIRRHNLLFSIL